MRVLYVALTRAKEKLIITGLEKDYKKSIEKKEELLNSYKETGKINKNIISKYTSYLDWIELVNLKCKKELEDILTQKVYKKQEILKLVTAKEEKQEIDLSEKLKKVKDTHKEELKQKLDWDYGYKQPKGILTKTSVTKIKEMKIDLREIEEEKKEAEYKTPEFMQGEKELTNAEKGTLMHLMLQKLDEKQEYNEQKIQELIQELREKQIITEKEEKEVDLDKLLNFTKTKIWQDLKTAKQVQKEKPFYINIKAKEIYEEEGADLEEEILVQGIIDLYYETPQGTLVLVDYKTDKIKEEAELINKYSTQLKVYKKALEQGAKKQVEAVYIYSIYLDKEIKIWFWLHNVL